MDRVTRAEAARQLEVDRATITREVQKNPALLDERGMVNVDELRAVRQATLNPKLQTRGVGAVPPVSNLNASRERTETTKAEIAELDLAERLGLTLRRQDVEQSIAAAGDMMRQVALQVARDQAERLTRIIDVREMERALEDMMRIVLTQSAASLSLAAASTGSAQAA